MLLNLRKWCNKTNVIKNLELPISKEKINYNKSKINMKKLSSKTKNKHKIK